MFCKFYSLPLHFHFHFPTFLSSVLADEKKRMKRVRPHCGLQCSPDPALPAAELRAGLLRMHKAVRGPFTNQKGGKENSLPHSLNFARAGFLRFPPGATVWNFGLELIIRTGEMFPFTFGNALEINSRLQNMFINNNKDNKEVIIITRSVLADDGELYFGVRPALQATGK